VKAVLLLVAFGFLPSFFSQGLAQCTELCLQLRGDCGKRQVPGAVLALQHNLGLGGAVVVAYYKMAFPQ
jgi:sterol carrier protein 2